MRYPPTIHETAMDTERLRRLLLVMLSSDQPGEIANAAAMVKKLLEKEKLDAHWLVDMLAGPLPKPKQTSSARAGRWPQPAPQTLKRRFPELDWQQILLDVSSQRGILRQKEIEFVGSLLEQATIKTQSNPHWSPSAKQVAWLEGIYARLFGYDEDYKA